MTSVILLSFQVDQPKEQVTCNDQLGMSHPDLFQEDKVCLLTYEQRIVNGAVPETIWSSRCSNQKACQVRSFFFHKNEFIKVFFLT